MVEKNTIADASLLSETRSKIGSGEVFFVGNFSGAFFNHLQKVIKKETS